MKRSLFSLMISVLYAVVLLASIRVAVAAPVAKFFPDDVPDPPITSGVSQDIEAHDEWLLDVSPTALAATMNYTYPVVDQVSPIVAAWMASIDVQDVTDYVSGLSGEEPVTIGGLPYTIVSRRTDSGESIEKAVLYVGERLAASGLSVEVHPWQASSFSGDYSGENVIGEIAGTTAPEKIFMITGHLDSQPSGPLAPGADDNASGSTAVLLAAETLAPYTWACTLRFALWTGEEQGLLGSKVYAQRSRTEDEQILGVLNFDMIAWNTPGSSPDIDIHARESITSSLALANLFAEVIDVYQLDLIPEIVPDGTGASDHASFWRQGYPAILGIEDYHPSRHDFNPYYHSPDDRIEHLDMDYFTEFVRAAIGGMAHMSDCLVTGAVRGHVTIRDGGMPIGGAAVAATSRAGHTFTTVTDSDGYYTITLPVDTLTVTAVASGFLSETVGNLALPAGVDATQNFSLASEPPRAAVQVEKTLDTTEPVLSGDTFDFIITITNTGNVTLTSVPLTDTYDSDYLSYLSSQPPSDDESDNDGVINWQSLTSSLPPGEHVEVIAQFRAEATTGDLPLGVTENWATASGVDETIAGLRGRLDLFAPQASDSDVVRIVTTLSVSVSAGDPRSNGSQVILEWTTFDERAMKGFHVVRLAEDAAPVVVTETMIPAEFSGMPVGGAYQFVDKAGIRSTDILYELQIFYIDGTMEAMHVGSVPRHPSLYLPVAR